MEGNGERFLSQFGVARVCFRERSRPGTKVPDAEKFTLCERILFCVYVHKHILRVCVCTHIGGGKGLLKS